MYELLIIACLAVHPAQCDEFRIPFEQPMGILACLQEAQLRLAQWSATMPEWAIRRWTCGLPRA